MVSNQTRGIYNFGTRRGFYSTFVSVVFGFLASISIQWFLERVPNAQILPHEWALFIGVMFIIVHFWLVCVASEDTEKGIYILADEGNPSKTFALLYLTNILFSLAIACPIATMSRNCFTGDLIFWKAYVGLGSLSLGYDIVAICFSVIALGKDRAYSEKDLVKRYATLYGTWLLQDIALLGVSLLLYYVRKTDLVDAGTLAFIFCGLSLLGLCLDVVFLHPDLYIKGKE
jgi:hypothetical protein